MTWRTRFGLFAAGIFVILLARAQLHAGHWAFDHAGYRQTTFAAAGYGLGALLILLVFLPPESWIYKHITTKPWKLPHQNYRRRRRHSPE